jgi:hypothetical protein
MPALASADRANGQKHLGGLQRKTGHSGPKYMLNRRGPPAFTPCSHAIKAIGR